VAYHSPILTFPTVEMKGACANVRQRRSWYSAHHNSALQSMAMQKVRDQTDANLLRGTSKQEWNVSKFHSFQLDHGNVNQGAKVPLHWLTNLLSTVQEDLKSSVEHPGYHTALLAHPKTPQGGCWGIHVSRLCWMLLQVFKWPVSRALIPQTWQSK